MSSSAGWLNFSESDTFFSSSLSEIPSRKSTYKDRKENAECYRQRVCAIIEGENRMPEFSFHLDVLIKISHTADTSPASEKFIMNRETYCRVSYQCSSLGAPNIDLFH